MHVVEHADPDKFEVRSHPWQGSLTDPTHRYHDLKKHPELIRSALEDFLPFAAYPAVETFYQLLEWLNGPTCVLQTNDCAFNGPGPNEMAKYPALQCSGRVMVLYRELKKNRDSRRISRIADTIATTLLSRDEDFGAGIIGVTIVPVRLTALLVNEDDQLGWQLMLSFWAIGDDPDETLENLDRTLTNLSAVLRQVAAVKPRRGRRGSSKGSPPR